jgi:hypothetical protein
MSNAHPRVRYIPCTKAQLKQIVDKDGWIDDIVVSIDLYEILALDLEGFRARLAEKVGAARIDNLTTRVVGHEGNDLHIWVSGYVIAESEG